MSALTERAAAMAAKFDAHEPAEPTDPGTRNGPPKGTVARVTSPVGGEAQGGAEPPYPKGATGYHQPSSTLTTRRQPRAFRPRPTEWAPVAADVFDQLDELGPMVERLYVIGDRPGGTIAGVRAWATGALPLGWEQGDGHYLEGNLPVLRYRRTDGRALEIHRAAGWFGDDAEPTNAEATAAMGILAEMVDRYFDGGAILATPASTGRLLLMRSLGRHEYPVLDPDTQALIRSTSGQGRIELLPAPTTNLWAEEVYTGRRKMAGLVEYDGRMMYAGCVRELGHGVPTHDGSDEFAGYTRGRYLVAFTVPKEWAHVGILGVHDDGGGWRWPRNPGEEGEAWVDATELRLALDHGWRVRIIERLLFPDHSGRPLDKWAGLLVKIREGLLMRARVGSVDPAVAELAAAAVRSILLHGIGALHGTGHLVTKTSTNIADVPANAGDTWRVDGDVHVWAEERGQAWPEMVHPEWSAAVWGRARSRLLSGFTGRDTAPSGALHVDPSTVVAFRTDAVYLTTDPRWHDDGAVGRLRRRSTIPGPLPWPTTSGQLLAMKADR